MHEPASIECLVILDALSAGLATGADVAAVHEFHAGGGAEDYRRGALLAVAAAAQARGETGTNAAVAQVLGCALCPLLK